MHNLVKAVGLAAMLLAAGCSAQAHKPAYDGWSLLAPLPVPNSETGVTELDGKIYVIGGYPSDRKTVATVQMYDSASDKWQIVAPLPVPLNHVMAAAANGRVYVIGGQTSETMAFIKGLIHLPGGGTTVGGSTGSVIHQVYKPGMSCR